MRAGGRGISEGSDVGAVMGVGDESRRVVKLTMSPASLGRH